MVLYSGYVVVAAYGLRRFVMHLCYLFHPQRWRKSSLALLQPASIHENRLEAH